MDNKDDKFWMSMIRKHENRTCELEEQQCNLEQRLLNLKRRISSSHNDICSCCSELFEPTPSSSRVRTNAPPVATPKVEECNDLSISLNSMDMQYISTLYELIDREKKLKQQVHKMETREQALLSSLKLTNQTCESRSRNCGVNDESGRAISNLQEENARIAGELEDVKLELKHCMEKYHGPMTRTLEQERRRSQQLENDLKATAEEMSTKECCYREDMCCLKSQMEELAQSLAEVTQQNENLQRQLCSMGRKYKDLQRDLISQKINEARTLERLNELLSEKERTVVRERRFKTQETQLDPQSVPQREEKGKADVPPPRLEHNLYAIARSLSRSLLNINQCDICRESVPEDLKATITGIKVITDIVDRNSTRNDATKSNDGKPPDNGPGGGKFPLPPRQRDDPASDFIGKTDDDGYGGDSGRSDGGNDDLTDATDLPAEDEVAVVQMNEDIRVLTEVEASGDLQVQVDTFVEVSDDVGDDLHVTTTVTSSGMLEVVTEGPAGIIETIMLRTPSGNLEVVTEIMDYPENLAIAESGDTSQDLDTNVIEDVGAELERAGDFADSVCQSTEEEEFFSAHIFGDGETQIADGIEESGLLEDGVLAPIMEVEGETPLDEVDEAGPDESDKVPMNEFVSSGPIRYVISDTTDIDRSKSGRKEHRKKFMSKIPVSASFPYKGPVCNCGKCGCVECFGRILAEPHGERGLDEKPDSLATGKVCNLPDEVSLLTYTSVASARPTKPHPPDCDCVDCLCDPCASFPSDYATRIHPPDCDCIDCLCGEFPCAPRCAEPKPTAPAEEIKSIFSEKVVREPISESLATPTEPSERSAPVKETLPDERAKNVDDNAPDIAPLPIKEVDPVERSVPAKALEPVPITELPPVERPVPAKTFEPVPIKEIPPEERPVPANALEPVPIKEIPLVERSVPAKALEPLLIQEKPPVERPVPAKALEPVSAVNENSSPVKQPQGEGEKLNHKAGCECDLCRCCNCGEVPQQLIAPKKCESACDTGHRSNCSCIDCLLSCGFPNKTKEMPKAEGETLSDGGVCDCVTCQAPCASPTCSQIQEAAVADLQVCLDQIKCACLNAEASACCAESQSGQNLLTTLRGIMANLQAMCTAENMANFVNELRAKANSILFSQMLPKVAPSLNLDQTQDDIYSCACKGEKTDKSGAYLRNPCTCGSDSCYCFDQDQEGSCCSQNCEGGSIISKISNESLCSCTSYAEPQLVCRQNAPSPPTSDPVEITEVKKVSSDGLLIKWTPPSCQEVTGYEVVVDGKLKSKVRSAFRTSAIIYSLASGSLNLKVYATTSEGRCEPPANTMYQF
ncbi:hypothetical protein PPYR_14652 [Photinus pyralis]|uniref:Uncharacterized protein n=2 Tax=Photinus pyralis TaxID=7054 RepID=A0A5N4A5U1_PHOPY|nr:hypothetical protein PPYR_14652 [Photinus pyralis]